MWILWLVACWEPTETGPLGMVGRIVKPSGIPAKGVSVESVEARAVTDDEGHFAVSMQEPNTHVDFQWGGGRYRRTYRPAEDAGEVLTIALPRTTDARVTCERPEPCTLRLDWTLGEGLRAHAVAACDPKGVPLMEIPDTPPDRVTCQGRGVAPAIEVDLARDGAEWRVAAPPAPIRVEIRTDDARAPAQCEVTVAGVRAEPEGEEAWTGSATGTVTVAAVCDGQPAVPQTATAGSDMLVGLDWRPDGPTLDLAGALPGVDALRWVAEDAGWTVELAADGAGRFPLPPLTEGRYRVFAGEADLLATPPEAEPGTLVWTRAGEGWVGALVLSEDHVEGPLAVEVR